MNPNLDIVPSNLQQAIDTLFDGLNEGDREYIRTHRSSDARETLGAAIRGGWSMHDHTMPLQTWFRRTHGISRPNDTSDLILRGLWAKVRGEPFELEELVNQIKLHWTRKGENP